MDYAPTPPLANQPPGRGMPPPLPVMSPGASPGAPYGAFAGGYTPYPQPPGRSRKAILLIVSISVMLIAVAGAIIWSQVQKREARRLQRSETVEQRRQDAVSAFGEGTTIDASDPVQVEALRALFTKLSDGGRTGDGAKMASCFDIDRMLEEISAASLPGVAELLQQKDARKGFESGMRQSFGKLGNNFAWDGFEIRQIKPLHESSEAMVFLRVRMPDGMDLKYRWWVRRSGATYRIYDYEEMSMGMRATLISAAALSDATSTRGGAANALQKVVAGAQLFRQGDYAGAMKSFEALESSASQFPPQIEAMRQSYSAAALLQLERSDDAMAALEKSARLHPDQPALDLLRAAAHNARHEPDKALVSVDQYEAAMGTEALSFYQRGVAQAALWQTAAALASFRKGLEDTPTSADCFSGLAVLTGQKDLPEVQKRLAAFQNPVPALRAAGNYAIARRSAVALNRIVQLYGNSSDSFRFYFEAEVLVLQAEYAKAVEVFEKHAAAFRAEPLLRNVFQEEYALSLSRSGRQIEGYEAAQNKESQFVTSAESLLDANEPAKLDQLIAMHAKLKGNQGILLHYRGRAALLRGKPAEGEKLFRQALAAQMDTDWRGTHRGWVTSAMFDDGRGLEAYRTAEFKKPAFDLLMTLTKSNQKFDLLAQIVKAARTDFPGDVSLDFHLADAAWLKKDYSTVADSLWRLRESIDEEHGYLWPRLIQSLVHLDRAKEAVERIEWCESKKIDVSYPSIIAYVAAGNGQEAGKRLDNILKEEEMTLEEWLEDADEDMQKAIASPAMKSFRQKHSKLGPTTSPAK